ncbi:MAG: hypothetical protein PHE79_06480 [Eubacteriales bacterium]|nr:hypothetical protein [Eubacteriales bacterium]
MYNRIIERMDGIQEGLFGGKDLSELKENELADIRRRNMGFIFQQPTMLRKSRSSVTHSA